MSRASPESVFALAQAAMERGDWEGFFGCLDRTDLKKLARLGISPVGEDPQGAYSRVCIEHGVAVEQLEEVKTLFDAIQTSARQMWSSPAGEGLGEDSQDRQLQQSLRHRDLVRALDRAIDACLGSITDLAAFTAQIERLKRATLGGGSVSRSLFVGEHLSDVRVDGKKATALRQQQGGESEPIAFVQKRGQCRTPDIRPLTR
ncbi:hypothetical protein G3480_21140 [Thiorhodococcus mannitoliphagus]|uniref:Uncharacterized protein n=1 Tax=Thiorhodococcus mannitoliphagus TaxID=329406 RepID=A0A6P1DWT8_9GAMM|nr:hypothetical protein [Thiorhodococcus mannitoliphagus]NEX22777.1 hypothetical protein [Thiorhodococcus mannitoliphagus]